MIADPDTFLATTYQSPAVSEYLDGLARLRRLLKRGYYPHRLAGSWGELSDAEREEALAEIRERTPACAR